MIGRAALVLALLGAWAGAEWARARSDADGHARLAVALATAALTDATSRAEAALAAIRTEHLAEDRAALTARLLRLAPVASGIGALTVHLPTGRLLAATVPLPPDADAAAPPLLAQAAPQPRLLAGPDALGARDVVVVAQQIRDGAGRVGAVAVASLNATALRRVGWPTEPPPGLRLVVRDAANGTLVASGPAQDSLLWPVQATAAGAGGTTVTAQVAPGAALLAQPWPLAFRLLLVLAPALAWAMLPRTVARAPAPRALPPQGPLDGAADPLRLRRLAAELGTERALRRVRAFAREAAGAIAKIDDRIAAGRGTDAHRLATELARAAQPFGLLALEDALDRLAEALAAGHVAPRDAALGDLLRQGPRIASDLEVALSQMAEA